MIIFSCNFVTSNVIHENKLDFYRKYLIIYRNFTVSLEISVSNFSIWNFNDPIITTSHKFCCLSCQTFMYLDFDFTFRRRRLQNLIFDYSNILHQLFLRIIFVKLNKQKKICLSRAPNCESFERRTEKFFAFRFRPV